MGQIARFAVFFCLLLAREVLEDATGGLELAVMWFVAVGLLVGVRCFMLNGAQFGLLFILELLLATWVFLSKLIGVGALCSWGGSESALCHAQRFH